MVYQCHAFLSIKPFIGAVGRIKVAPVTYKGMFMKKCQVCFFVLITSFTILFTSCFSLSQLPKGKVECDVRVVESKIVNDREAIEFTVISGYDEYFASIYLKNNTNERIYIEWENARCNSGKIAFNDDRRITMNNPKQDESVASFSYSLTRKVTSQSKVMDDYLIPLYKKDDLIKGETKNVYLLIPIRFSDGKVIDYHVNLTYKWVPSDE